MTRSFPEIPASGHHDVALAFAAKDWPVFPCLPDKRPATPHGFKDATTDTDRVSDWWHRHPDHLVGMPSAGFVVVDLDNRPRADTWAWWYGNARENGWTLNDSPLIATPSGGLHVYFTCPPGVTVRNSASKLSPNVDIRSDGGYVILPGSTLPDRRCYELISGSTRDIVDVPQWLLDKIDKAGRPPAPIPPIAPGTPGNSHEGTRYGITGLNAELGRLATAPEGCRNDTLNECAFNVGQLAAGGQLDPVHAAQQLEFAAIRIGLTQGEAAATIRSGMAAGAQHPRAPANAR